jgi:septal ring-binding cell division protein DamX
MKKLAIVAVCLAATLSAYAQGTFAFGNRNTAAGIDAPVTAASGGRLDGTGYLAQLFVNNNPVGTAVPFRTGAAAGYISTVTVTVAGLAPGASAAVEMRAWRAAAGASWADAAASSDADPVGNAGKSATLTLNAGGVPDPTTGIPGFPSNLTGLASFSLVAVPEPSTIALALLGGAALFLRRRK